MTKVLLVEDDNNLREIYEARLAAEGYDISAAQDGEEALEVAKKVQPDLIISDVMMPRISGFEMLDILRNTQGLKHTKVIMLTALGQEEDKTRADSLGADRYLVKSQVTLEDIVKAADELLNGASATDEATDTPATAPQPQQSDLSPTAPPAVAAAAHSTSATPGAAPQQPLSSFEDTTTQPAAPAPAATTSSSAGEPIVGGPAPVTTATVASDPLASNDQTLQAAAKELSAQPAVVPTATPVAPAIVPMTTPTEPAATPTVPAVTPAVIDSTPVVEPASAPAMPAPEPAQPTEQTAPPLESQPVNQTVITPPEAQTQQLPSLPEIERAMQETAASAPAQGLVNGAPGIVTPDPTPAATTPPESPEPAQPTDAATPDMRAPTPAEQPASDFTRPSIGGTTPAAPAPDVALPEAQTTAQESATVTDQINNFAPPQFPANVSEVVEAPGSPDAVASVAPEPVQPAPVPEVNTPATPEQPAATPEMDTSVQPVAVEQAPTDPAAAAVAPSPSSLPATGGQRTIQPLTSNAPQMDINQLAAQEGSVTPPAGSTELAHQPGGVFTPDQSGSAADAAL